MLWWVERCFLFIIFQEFFIRINYCVNDIKSKIKSVKSWRSIKKKVACSLCSNRNEVRFFKSLVIQLFQVSLLTIFGIFSMSCAKRDMLVYWFGRCLILRQIFDSAWSLFSVLKSRITDFYPIISRLSTSSHWMMLALTSPFSRSSGSQIFR